MLAAQVSIAVVIVRLQSSVNLNPLFSIKTCFVCKAIMMPQSLSHDLISSRSLSQDEGVLLPENHTPELTKTMTDKCCRRAPAISLTSCRGLGEEALVPMCTSQLLTAVKARLLMPLLIRRMALRVEMLALAKPDG